MKKKLFMFSLATLLTAGVSQAQSYFSENFNTVSAPALPSNWASVPPSQWKSGNPDDLVPVASDFLGSGITTPAYSSTVGIDGSLAGADGAILSTPVINLPSGATTASIFFDIAYYGVQLTNDATKKETLTLLVSTNGGSTWSDVEVIEPNQNYIWESRMVSVGSYAGQSNLKFGFKYNNVAAALIGAALDNIRIFAGADLAIVSSQGGSQGGNIGYQTVGTGATITGSVANNGTTTISSYIVKYQLGSNAPVPVTISGSIAPLATGTFTHTTPFNVAAATNYPLKVWVEVPSDGDHTNDTTDIQITGVPFLPTKKLVFEEGTGAWCGFCPRGTKAMDEFAEANPGLATQIAVHNTAQGPDAMAYPAYVSFLNNYMSGYPSMVVDRVVQDDPSNVTPLYNALKNNFGFANITLGTPTVSANSVSMPVTVSPAIDVAGAKLALVVTESNLSGTGAGWDQHNYYSDSRGTNGDAGTLGGGWDAQPDPTVGAKYHFVARAISPSPQGAASGLPPTMDAGTTNQATLTATLDANWKPANLQYIVLLIGADGTILNSNFTTLPTLEAVLPTGTTVTNIAAGIEEAILYPNPTNDKAYLQVQLKDALSSSLTITDAIGRVVTPQINTDMHSGKNVIEIPTANLSSGMYLINLTTGKGNISMKLQVVK